jgi:hypothetical protein
MSSGKSYKLEDDIQKGIIYSLEKKGVLENLKAYLRTDIYNKLKKNDHDEESKQSKINYNNFLSSGSISNNSNLRSSSLVDFEKNKLIRLSVSLISDFLKKHSLNYTQSVFLSEYKKLISDDFWTESEIGKICNIDYSSLETSVETTFLSYLIKNNFLSQIFNKKESKSIETQTENENTLKNVSNISIEEKLKEIDSKYSKSINFESLMPAKTIEEKMLKYQRELDARFQSDLEREIQRIKECELSLMRIEENKKYMKKIEEIRDEYDREYREKFDFLKKKENDLNLRLNLKEKDLETQLYENRQKFLSELQTLKIKEDEMRIKSENDFSNSKLEEEKLKFKQKELDHVKESSMRRINEEIEQFKLEYDRKFELEKNEVRKMKLESEEREIKNNLYLEKMKSLEESLKFMTGEKDKLLRDLNSLERELSTYKKDNEMLRNELKILSDTEKRNSEMLSRKETETNHYKEENKILRESLEEHKKLSEERRRDQNILVENLKKQLEENLTRSEKSKDYYESELEKSKKNHTKQLEREKENFEEKIKELEKKIKNLETQLGQIGEEGNKKSMPISKNEFYNKRTAPTVQQGQGQGNSNLNSNRGCYNNYNNYNNTVTSSLNFNRGQTQSLHSAQSGNYFYTMNEIKASDRMMTLSKLEKEADELKNELKRNMISSRRENKESNMEKVYFELYEKLNKEKILQMNSNMMGSQGFNYNQTPHQNNNFNYNYVPSSQIQENEMRNNLQINQTRNEENLNSIQKMNNLKTISSVPEPKDEATSTIPQDSVNKKIEENEKMQEHHDHHIQQNAFKQNTKIESVRSDENIMNTINNSDTKRDERKDLKISPKTEKIPHHTEFIQDEVQNKKSEKLDDNSGKKEKESKNMQLTSNITDEEKLQLEAELNKMKDEYNKKLHNSGSDKKETEKSDQELFQPKTQQFNSQQTVNVQSHQFTKLPTPIIIGGNTSLRSKELERQDSANINDFSVANLTSSNEWELESLRKDKDPNLFKNVSNIQHNQSQQSMSLQVKEIIPLTALNEIKKEDQLEKVDKLEKTKEPEIIEKPIESKVKKELTISPILINYSQPEKKDAPISPRKLEVNPDPNQSVKLKALTLNNNNTNNSIKEESEESYNISNLIDNTKDKKSSIPSDSEIYKTSFNKFSNVNYEMDKNEIEEDIKVDGESENYDYDFVEDVDGLDKKMSVDLDAIKNASINFNNSVNNLQNLQQGQKNTNSGNNLYNINSPQSPHLNVTSNKSIYKSQSIDKQIEKLLQSKASGIEENIVEGRIYY